MSAAPAGSSGRSVERLSAPAARRIALAAQGFADPRPTGRVDARHIRRVLDRVGILQLDSVNVFCRSHYMPAFSRLGAYPREALDRLSAHTVAPAVSTRAKSPAGGSRRDSRSRPGRIVGVGGGRESSRIAVSRELFEYWAHEASLVPLELHPYLRWRMARADDDAWRNMVRIVHDLPHLVDDVYELVARQGPIRSGDTGIPRPEPRPGHMWNWHEGKVALEYLFWSGRVTAARRVNFERYYDLPERVLPAEVIATAAPPVDVAQRELVRIAARALGVATEPDLGDYFRLPRAESKTRVAELVEMGELLPVEVDGWRAPAYLWPQARRPRGIAARALLSPFDSLIWFRERTERLFGFRYRIEIYTPAAKRIHGYYVLPFLLGDSLVARVDLKSDRQAGVLRVQGAFAEPGVDVVNVAAELAAELATTAKWLDLDGVVVGERGDLAAPLSHAVLP